MRDYEALFGPETRMSSVIDEPLDGCYFQRGYVLAHEPARVLAAPAWGQSAGLAELPEDLAA